MGITHRVPSLVTLKCCAVVLWIALSLPVKAQDSIRSKQIQVTIEKITPTSFGFNVLVTVKNTGDRPIVLGESGEAPGRLQSLNIEQWDEKRGWQMVGPCRDLGPISTITLKPNDKIQNVEGISDLAHGWGSSVCPRNVKHLGGKIRAILYYAYSSEQEFADRMNNVGDYKHNGRVDIVSASSELPRQ